jgi:hypothetical protein
VIGTREELARREIEVAPRNLRAAKTPDVRLDAEN